MFEAESGVAILASVLAILLTFIFIFFFTRKQNRPKSEIPKSKEDILKARIKYFQSNTTKNQIKTDNKNLTSQQQKTPSENVKLEDLTKSYSKNKVPSKGKLTTTVKNVNKDTHTKERKNTTKTSTNKFEKANSTLSAGADNLPIIHLKSSSALPSLGDEEHQPPTIQPIRSLAELFAWNGGFDTSAVATVTRRAVTCDETKPKTLVCHDMRGGYTEDRFVQGVPTSSCYRFHSWNSIDTFVYFSHNLVTIPPPCWTNAAHTHGVKALGTLITEWNDGARICQEMFADEVSVQRVVDKMVAVTQYYGFDGWLVNIENPVAPSQVENVVLFLTLLKNSLQENHRPDTEVIWYDSVLNTGQLKWQNKLCAENKIFFDACDGIFLNYNWSASDLRLSAQTAASRRLDVYVGVDVFGRGCLGGGGWNTHVAMKAIREAKLSAAIFAPGWVMENNAEEEFTLNHNRFWELLAPYLHYHVITDLPLITSFCQGYGNSLYIQGQRVRATPWTNQSAVSLQLTFANSVYQLGPPDGLKVASVGHSIADAFNGGGCLKLTGTIQPRKDQSKTIIRLFKTSISLDCSNQYRLQLVYKSSGDKVNLFMVLLFADAPSYMVLQVTQNDGVVYTTPEGQNNNYSFIEHCGSPLETSNRWIKTDFSLPLEKNRTLQEIRVVLATGGLQHDDNEEAFEIKIGQIKIGQIKLCEKKTLKTPLSQPINIKCSNIQYMNLGETSKFSFQLTWQVNKSPLQPFCFDVFCRGVDGQAFELQSVSEASDFIVDASKTPKEENSEDNQGSGVNVSKIVGNNENEMADRRETLTHYSTEGNKIENSFGGNSAVNYGKFVGRTFTCCYHVTEFRAQTKCAGGCVFTIVERGDDVTDSPGNQGVVGRFLLRW